MTQSLLPEVYLLYIGLALFCKHSLSCILKSWVLPPTMTLKGIHSQWKINLLA